MKTKAVIVGVGLALVAAYALYQNVTAVGPGDAAKTYIEAVKARDFATVFELNHRTQKQVNILSRASTAELDELAKNLFVDSKQAFDAMNLTDDPTLTWAEKNFFTQGLSYRIVQAHQEATEGTPSSGYRITNVATVLVDAVYADPETAPVYRGRRIKEARYRLQMIPSRDVVKGMQTKPVTEGWLYQWFTIDTNTAVYWE